jgi:hypothetical protein
MGISVCLQAVGGSREGGRFGRLLGTQEIIDSLGWLHVQRSSIQLLAQGSQCLLLGRQHLKFHLLLQLFRLHMYTWCGM